LATRSGSRRSPRRRHPIAQTEFKSVKTIDENELKQDWPRLRAALGKALLNWIKMSTREKIQSHEAPPSQPCSIPLWRQRFIFTKKCVPRHEDELCRLSQGLALKKNGGTEASPPF
jgi:hypothetical protein